MHERIGWLVSWLIDLSKERILGSLRMICKERVVESGRETNIIGNGLNENGTTLLVGFREDGMTNLGKISRDEMGRRNGREGLNHSFIKNINNNNDNIINYNNNDDNNRMLYP